MSGCGVRVWCDHARGVEIEVGRTAGEGSGNGLHSCRPHHPLLSFRTAPDPGNHVLSSVHVAVKLSRAGGGKTFSRKPGGNRQRGGTAAATSCQIMNTYPFGSLLHQAQASHGQLGIVGEEDVLHGHVALVGEVNGAGWDGQGGGGHDWELLGLGLALRPGVLEKGKMKTRPGQELAKWHRPVLVGDRVLPERGGVLCDKAGCVGFHFFFKGTRAAMPFCRLCVPLSDSDVT